MLDIDIRLRRGQFERHVRIAEEARVLALTGPSGAGKTSVLSAIAASAPITRRLRLCRSAHTPPKIEMIAWGRKPTTATTAMISPDW